MCLIQVGEMGAERRKVDYPKWFEKTMCARESDILQSHVVLDPWTLCHLQSRNRPAHGQEKNQA